MTNQLLAFEGCVGAGKTTLSNYFSENLGIRKILEDYQSNPFLESFYDSLTDESSRGAPVDFQTELNFVLIHLDQLMEHFSSYPDDPTVSDFSLEKDLVYADLNLEGRELEVFHTVYDYAEDVVGLPGTVIYLDLSVEVLQRRIFQRGRPYELEADPDYIKAYNDRVKEHFQTKSKSDVHFFQVDDLVLDPKNDKLTEIREVVEEALLSGS